MTLGRLLAASVIISLAFWLATGINSYARQEYAALASSEERPMLLTGIRFDLGLLGADSLTLPTLLLVVDDDCIYCQQELPRWQEAATRGIVPPAISVLLVSKRGHRLAEDAAASFRAGGSATAVIRLDPIRAAAFSFKSGAMGTPLLVLLDRSGAIRVVGNRLNEKFMVAVLDELASWEVVH